MNGYPLIGVSGSHNEEARQFFVRENYMESVIRGGGIPMLLPESKNPDTVYAMLDKMDGLLLAGGGDVAPFRYNMEKIPQCEEADEQRDVFELLLIGEAMKRNMPIFGICRGIQILNVALGGTLIQDIECQLGIPNETHQQKPPYGRTVHDIEFVPDGFFVNILSKVTAQGNSMHHQAVLKAAPELIVEGKSPDGVIEAVRHVDRPHVFAVQYHPEYISDWNCDAQKLFNYFVQCSKKYSESK